MTPTDPLFHADQKTALVCLEDPDAISMASEYLAELGYKVHHGLSMEDLLYKMQANSYDLVLIAEHIGNSLLETNPLIEQTRQAPATQRHQQLVIVIGPSLTTGDEKQAFQLSVDQVIHTDDLPNLRPLVRRCVARSEEFYGRYLEAIAAADRV